METIIIEYILGYNRGYIRVYIGIMEKKMETTIVGSFPKIRVPQYRPQYTIVLIIGTPKKVPFPNSSTLNPKP